MASIEPYLIFNGTCEQAIKFYAQVFDVKCEEMMTYKDAPGMDVPEHWKSKIIHTFLTIRGQKIMASDSFPGHEVKPGNNVYISVNFKKEEKIDDLFKRLSEGGEVQMPLQNTFWGAYFGQFKDKYGTHWMFNQYKQ